MTGLPYYSWIHDLKIAAFDLDDNENNITKLIGNEKDPHCYGRLCPRGTGGVGMYSDTDRLKTPLIRVKNEGTEDVFKEASWEEALTLVASKKHNDGYKRTAISLGKLGDGFTFKCHNFEWS